MITREQLARHVDHTLLRTDATVDDVRALAAEARELGVFSICVSPSVLADIGPVGGGVATATVCGFPSGKHTAEVKAAEAARAVADGADEVDMVIDIGLLRAGREDRVRAEVETVRQAMPGSSLLKVIIESAALSPAEVVAACLAAESGGAQLVKTSTGFHPSGGATLEAVRLMADTVGGRLGVKASGGIRTWADAVAMIEAGATRLGLSGTRAVLDGSDAGSGSSY